MQFMHNYYNNYIREAPYANINQESNRPFGSVVLKCTQIHKYPLESSLIQNMATRIVNVPTAYANFLVDRYTQ